MHKLILASKSPRRKMILEENGFHFETFSVEVSEILDKNLNIADEILRLAETKGMAAAKSFNYIESQDYLFLSADTLVVCEGRVFGKPKNSQEATEFLELLSGDVHQVLTGFSLLDHSRGKVVSKVVSSDVEFFNIEPDAIAAYVSSGAPMDKAGAYGIQDSHGFVKRYTGEFENIVGLPIQAVTSVIQSEGWNVARADF